MELPVPSTAPTEGDTASDHSWLCRNLRWTIRISFPISAISLWPLYDQYWRFRGLFQNGNYVDATGQARYAESAVWGALTLFSFAVGLGAVWMLKREQRREVAPTGENG